MTRVMKLIDATPQRYLEPPAVKPLLRRSSEQCDELATLYRSIITRHSGSP
jgi:hypothetical protein